MPMDTLLSISSEPLGHELVPADWMAFVQDYPSAANLFALLQQKNGFFAFESALHVFPFGQDTVGYSLQYWNAVDTWKSHFDLPLTPYMFFAEDIFGVQFGLHEGSVVRFDPESSKIDEFAQNVEDWVARILADYEVETGYPLARTWQKANGPLPHDKRLLPKEFFLFGGEFTVDNLYPMDAVQGMQLRGDVYNQIKNLPDGSKIKLVTR